MKKIFAFIVLLATAQPVFAQQYFGATQEKFGKNRIQTKRFEWKTIKSSNFEVNYYRGGEELAKKTTKIAEAEFSHITEVLGYTPFTNMKIFVYNSAKDLGQSNVGITSPIDYNGGILNLARSRVEIAFTGRDESYKEEIISQIAHLFVYDMLYGGSIKEVLQSSLMLSVPSWYMSGVARYIANDNTNPEIIDYLRSNVVALDNQKINYLSDEKAAIIGHSIWWYIAKKYGEDNISNILNLTRIIRTEESSITSTLGISYTRFLREWKDFYQNESYKIQAETEFGSSKNEGKTELVSAKETLANKEDGEVDTENYEFDPAIVASVLKNIQSNKGFDGTKNSTTRRIKTQSEELVISEPKALQNLLMSNETKTEFLVDPIRRLGAKTTFQLNDVLENNIFKLSAFVAVPIKNHDISAEYTNTRKRLDWSIGFDRRSLFIETISIRNQYLFRPLNISLPQASSFSVARRLLLHSFSATAAYPLNENLRVAVTPFLTETSDADFSEIGKTRLQSFYGGAESEIVFDNTFAILGDQLFSGTKAKLRLERYLGIGNTKGFSRMLLDVRHYQKIVKGVWLAGRLSFGRSLGNDPQISFLGGTENWINRKFQESNGQAIGIPGDLRSLLFNNYPGSLRGFNFGKIYGTNHVLTNLELGIAVADFLPKGAVTTNSFRNLQLIAFNDIGSAWKGNQGPFSRENSLNTEIIGGGANPFKAVVINFKNPFLLSYGLGLRTTLFGYFVRLDQAWGVEDKLTNKPMLHLSIGHDF